MDPHQTFLDMFEAMKDEDHATARELALALHRWFAKGGVCPEEYSPDPGDQQTSQVAMPWALDETRYFAPD